MPRTRVLLVLLALPFLSWAQRPQTPVIDSVSIDAQGSPVIAWRTPDPNGVDGFYIYRYVEEGDGIVGNNFYKIAAVSDEGIRFLQDNYTVYGSSPQPGQRPEQYGIAAYTVENTNLKDVGSDSIQLSIMSEPHRSVYLYPLDFDSCASEVVLRWKPYSPWRPCETRYEIYARENGQQFRFIGARTCSEEADTIFRHKHVKAATQYTYFVRAKNQNSGFTSSSNRQQAYTAMPVQPERVSPLGVSTANGAVRARFLINPEAEANAYILDRRLADAGQWKEVHRFVDFVSPLAYEDREANARKEYLYRLRAINFCDIEYKVSDSANNVVLSLQNHPQRPNELIINWNAPNYWHPDSMGYKLVKISEGDGKVIEASDQKTYRYTLDPETETTVCFRVEAQNSQSGELVTSNTACNTVDAILGLPNAFVPESNIPENRVFKPKMGVVDDYALTIINRHGTIVFQGHDPAKGWNGRTSNGLAPEGAYIVQIRYTRDGKTQYHQSVVTLIRK